MARDYIKVDRTQSAAIKAGLLLSYISTLQSAINQGNEIKFIMDHNTDSSVWTDIEGLFGLLPGKGQTVYNLVAGSVGAIAGTVQDVGAKTLTQQVGG